MSVSVFHDLYQRLCETITADEPICLICGQELEESAYLFCEKTICETCRSSLERVCQVYSIHGKDWYVLYEYNDFLERLWFRYKDQRDLLLRSLFLEEIDPRFFLSYSICGLCSSEAKRFERGFEPLRDIFIAQGLDFYSPFYKEKDWKQNQMDKVQRSGIVSVLKKKRFFPSIEKPIVLVDDVCTTGASLEAALSLVDCAIIFVVSAHPKWIEEHKKDIVERKRVPWKSSAKQVERRWTGFLKKRLYSEDGGKL